MKKVLVLGAGLVTRPHVEYLLNVAGFRVTVASRTLSKAQALIGDRVNGSAVQLDVSSTICRPYRSSIACGRTAARW